MRIGRSLAALLLMLLSWVCLPAQTNTRPVRGQVQDENGQALPRAVITSDQGETFTPNEDGSFEIQVSFNCRTLTFSAPLHLDVTLDVDGSYLLAKLKVDKAAEAKLRKEAEAKAKAEEKAREDARKEAEAKAKAEEKARVKAEQERLAAEEKVRKKAENLTRENDYNARFKNKGIEHNVSISYAYGFSSVQFTYLYSGIRNYSNLHPVELDYTFSYKFNRLFSVGAGAGLLFNLKSVTIIEDEMVGDVEGFKEKRLDLPVFLSAKIRPFKTVLRPYIELKGGYYLLSSCLTGEGALGAEYRIGRGISVNVGAFVSMAPYPHLENRGYKASLFAGAKLGFSF